MSNTPALLHDAVALEALHDTLDVVIEAINDDEAFVPERYAMSARGLLAEADYYALMRASSVIHRLGMWARYPLSADAARYVVKAPESPASAAPPSITAREVTPDERGNSYISFSDGTGAVHTPDGWIMVTEDGPAGDEYSVQA